MTEEILSFARTWGTPVIGTLAMYVLNRIQNKRASEEAETKRLIEAKATLEAQREEEATRLRRQAIQDRFDATTGRIDALERVIHAKFTALEAADQFTLKELSDGHRRVRKDVEDMIRELTKDLSNSHERLAVVEDRTNGERSK